MSKTKFSLSLILFCIGMLLSGIVNSSAATVVSSGNCGENITWELTSDHILTISGNGEMYDYDEYPNPAPWTGFYIENIIIGDGITSIGEYAFCGNDTNSITIGKNVARVGYGAFTYHYTKKVHISDIASWISIDFIDSTSSPITYDTKIYLNNELVTEVTIPDGCSEIKDYAFYEYQSLTSITIPASIKQIGNNAFYGCSSLNDVYISDLEAWCNIDFEEYFYVESNSGRILVLDSNPLIYADNFWLNSELITDLVIPNGIKSIKQGAFKGYRKLKSVKIPNSVTEISTSAFQRCTGLTGITIPDNVTKIGIGAFDYCIGLTDITIPNSVTSIGDTAFSDCSSLTSIKIPDSVTSIGCGAFSGCKKLISINIPDGITGINRFTFQDCTNLTSIVIPDSVTSIVSWAFNGCSNLSDIYYEGTPETWSKIKIEEKNDYLTNATLNYIMPATENDLVPLIRFEAEDGHEYAVKYGDNIVSGDGITYDYAKHGAYQVYFGKFVSNTYKKPKAQGITINYTTNSGDVVTYNFTAKTPFSSGAPFGILIFGGNFRNGLTAKNYIEY